ncbi:unnamed protein product [Cuscuta campestris]|uniref:Uncharacterized protein n=1 Tax=Cuscuta campestris TaxID=132261 RepID=A0A484KB49_9ASTE|nr:unnamed protein product [Cuscuta campestris]
MYVHNIALRDQGPPFALHESELKGKKVLLYFNYYSTMEGGYVFKPLEGCYDRMKQVYPNSEVLFAPLEEFTKPSSKRASMADFSPFCSWLSNQ